MLSALCSLCHSVGSALSDCVRSTPGVISVRWIGLIEKVYILKKNFSFMTTLDFSYIGEYLLI